MQTYYTLSISLNINCPHDLMLNLPSHSFTLNSTEPYILFNILYYKSKSTYWTNISSNNSKPAVLA